MKDRVFDIFDQFAADPRKELEGVWVPIGPVKIVDGKAVPGSEPALLIARSGNKKHARLVSQAYEANKTTIESKTEVGDEKGVEVTVDTMARGVLIGWKNIVFDKRAIPDGWNLADAKAMLAHTKFRELVNQHANDFSKYKAVQEAEDAGN
jgi:hypothetical protein